MINMANKNNKNTGKINKQKQMETKKRKNKKSKLLIIVMLLIIGGISAYLLTSPSFAIQGITIKGNNNVSRQQILNLANIQMGDNLFSKIGIIMKVKLKQNGYIQDAKITKTYPNIIEINVTERKQQFQIYKDTEGYIYIDEQGYILQHSKDKLEIPTIAGLDVTVAEANTLKRLSQNDLNKMENILQIRQEFINIGLADKITQYQVKNEYVISFENDGITINLGDATNLKNRMYYVNAILKQEAGNKGTIYVNGNLNEGFSAYFSAN